MACSKWSCKTCGLQFEKRGQRDNHQQREHRQSIIGGANIAEDTVARSEDGKCGRKFWHPRSLKRHSVGCNASILMVHSDSESEGDSQGMYQSPKRWDIWEGMM
jgi:hypothetical protein